jgi:hypothetical protein
MFAAKYAPLEKNVLHTENTFNTERNLTNNLFQLHKTLLNCKITHSWGSFPSNSFSSLLLGFMSPLTNSF